MPCPRTQHRNNVSILRVEKHDISLKIMHQAGFETARQAATLAKLRALYNHCATSLSIALKVVYHPLYGINNYVLICGDWLSYDPLRGSYDSQSPHIGKHLFLVATLIYLSQIYSYYIMGDRSFLNDDIPGHSSGNHTPFSLTMKYKR